LSIYQDEEATELPTLTPIASPLAPKKLHKKLLRATKKASKARQLRRGVKEVVKALRKGEQGLLLLAGNITPVDVLSHMPLLAEESKGVEYVWVVSKEELGAAAGTKRATSVVLLWSVLHLFRRFKGFDLIVLVYCDNQYHSPQATYAKEWRSR
jgi:H/ACA ribonucleoprotein complex subunit 2